MAIGIVMMALFWVAIFAGFYYLGRSLGRRGEPPAGDGPPSWNGLPADEIARRRLASGDIDETQYERLIARLSGGRGAAR